ncbi:S-adenosyl-L-methionine-dependent methyltransferase [Microdochium trichocladiopsis]|uniref:S-adenosyl-L-methionine-dependent methyltransferase n=1 Tax=Microdochium trichocladiopsis TaxID=1682393 RepID=A0A9P8XUR9_9PEZI|nr:S-adenosyl-L-methionine-dependent methyltransferase [Microdochium trichocladiopsis]KAH7018473.1 S-adenosyl-L-methionine-dependent methyltransferase [Microdochium trichocladiopsis]
MASSTAAAIVPEDPAVPAPPPQASSPPTDAPTTEGQPGASQPPPPTPPPASAGILPASHWQQRADEEEEFENDSAYAESIVSSTASLSASILEYRTLHGRTYHSELGEGQSWNPNDAQHDEAMDILHHMSTLMQDGKLYLADLGDNIGKVLDVGCGTGIWAIDFADQHPEAEVIGLDISPQQPHWIPVNLKFEVDDITQPWTYPENTFDYIHLRWLVGSIGDWTALYKEIFKALKSGGIFEHKESSCVIQSDDATVGPDTALAQWGKVFLQAGTKFNRTFAVHEEGIQVKAMEAAGFVDVQVTEFKVPIGAWPLDKKMKTVGKYAQLALQRDVEGFVTFMWSSVMGWSKEEIAVYAAHLRKELKSGKFNAYYPMRVVIGRKP